MFRAVHVLSPMSAAALLGLAIACVHEPLGPHVSAHPTVGAIEVVARTVGWPTTDSAPELGVVVIRARPVDSLFQLAEGAYLPVAITTSRGDSETVALHHELCWRERSAYLCDEIIISMDSGHAVWELRDEFRAAGTRLNSYGHSGRFGCLTVLGEDTNAALTAARGWPHVSSADLNGVMWLDPGPGAAAHAALGVSVALDLAAGIRGNGVVEILRGDTVTVRYRQPDGSLLSAAAVVP